MGVIALTFFDPRSSRGPQRLPESAIWKNAYLAPEPERYEILIFAASVIPHYFQILRGVSFIALFDLRSSRYTYGVKWWKWGVSRQINIGLQIISDL